MMLQAWHELLTDSGFSVNYIIALLRETSTYHETKLLGAAGALEALAKRLAPGNDYKEQAVGLAQRIAPAVRDRVVPDVDKWAESSRRHATAWPTATRSTNAKSPKKSGTHWNTRRWLC